jgi:hypothetical protein
MRHFDYEPEAKIGRRHARCATDRLRVPYEVGHVGAMRALHDANSAVRVGDLPASAVERRPDEAGVGPFPDVPGEVVQSLAVGAECAAWLRRLRLRPLAG